MLDHVRILCMSCNFLCCCSVVQSSERRDIPEQHHSSGIIIISSWNKKWGRSCYQEWSLAHLYLINFHKKLNNYFFNDNYKGKIMTSLKEDAYILTEWMEIRMDPASCVVGIRLRRKNIWNKLLVGTYSWNWPRVVTVLYYIGTWRVLPRQIYS